MTTRFSPRRWAQALAMLLSATACGDGPVSPVPTDTVDLRSPWVVVTPEVVGLDAATLADAGRAASEVGRMRSLLVVRRGQLAYERYWGGWDENTLADVRSVTKSVVSALTGIALSRGELQSLDQPITDFLSAPEFPVTSAHRAITLRHLLSMSSGIQWAEGSVTEYNAWVTAPDQVAYVLQHPVEDLPGSTFNYNSAGVHLLGVALEKAVGRPLPEYADDVLFGPVGIATRQWEDVNAPYVNGGSGLDLRPRDLARFGQLFLQKGWSGSTKVVEPEWVDASIRRRWGNLGSAGSIPQLSYGFLWWLDVQRNAFFAWGHGGQFIYVLPEQDLVVVATTEWRGASADIGATALEAASMSVIVDGVLPAVR